MSTESKGRKNRVETGPDTGWPQWIADALAYQPEKPAPELKLPEEPTASESDGRRNIRILSRVVKT
jgi:hypothetical protein